MLPRVVLHSADRDGLLLQSVQSLASLICESIEDLVPARSLAAVLLFLCFLVPSVVMDIRAGDSPVEVREGGILAKPLLLTLCLSFTVVALS